MVRLRSCGVSTISFRINSVTAAGVTRNGVDPACNVACRGVTGVLDSEPNNEETDEGAGKRSLPLSSGGGRGAVLRSARCFLAGFSSAVVALQDSFSSLELDVSCKC